MNKKNTKFAYAINAPLIIYLACVLLGPIIWGIWMSFTIWTQPYLKII